MELIDTTVVKEALKRPGGVALRAVVREAVAEGARSHWVEEMRERLSRLHDAILKFDNPETGQESRADRSRLRKWRSVADHVGTELAERRNVIEAMWNAHTANDPVAIPPPSA
jgi:hypothetical protein